MSLFASKLKLLSILAENTRKPYPEVVNSESIADKLAIGLGETRQMIQCLNSMGAIQCDIEGQHSLITQKGMHLLEKFSVC